MSLIRVMRPQLGAGGSPTLVNTYITTEQSSTFVSSTTFSSVAIGTASSDRFVIVSAFISSGAAGTIDSVSIGGDAATEIFSHPSWNAGTIAYYGLKVTTGTTADIIVTSNASRSAWVISVNTITGNDSLSLTPVNSVSYNNSSSLIGTLDINTPSGSSVLLATSFITNSDPPTTTWVGATEDSSVVETRTVDSASELLSSAETPRTVNVTYGGISATKLLALAVVLQ